MSHESERLHRQDPARDGPNREFSSYVRSQGIGGRPTSDDPVAQGVKLGYSVLDEQMREGRRLAERLRGGLRPGAAAAPEFGALIERALNIYRDMGALAFAAAEALAGASGQRGAKPESAPVQAIPYAIESVGFEAAPGAEPKLTLEIADDQPAGVYNAVVVDAESGEALGTLTVRISA
jgi:hypothetical protein